MSLATQDDVMRMVIGTAAEQARTEINASVKLEYAVVRGIEPGGLILCFSGDDLPAGMLRKYLKSYDPAVGDRVMLINGIVIGGWTP
jgi:hypothetical protein